MAPLRSHIFHLFKTLEDRKKSILLVWCKIPEGSVL